MKNPETAHTLLARSRSQWRQAIAALLLAALSLFLAPWFTHRAAAAFSPPAAGSPKVSYLRCAPGYRATFYARGLRAPDGLAFDPGGALYVVEERGRRVRRINADGSTTRVLDGLRSPEGIAFDGAGNLYVVEDTSKGRLIRLSPDGQRTTLAENLSAPEGVAVGPEPDGGGAPTVYVTESNVQFVRNPLKLRSGITAVTAAGDGTPVITHAPKPGLHPVSFWSYAGLTAGPDGLLYVTNELSGLEISRRVVFLSRLLTYSAKLLTNDSIFSIDPRDGTRTLVAGDLLVPEGLRFSAGGDFPLYVAEENVGSKGRLSRVERNGRRSTVCDGFRGIEDVAVDQDGTLFVSEDRSGSVIRIQVSEEAGQAVLPDPDPSGKELLPRIQGQIVGLARRIVRRFHLD